METPAPTRLGYLLLQGNLIQEDDLERCLEIQALSGGSRPLGQILIEQGIITQEELDAMLAIQQATSELSAEPLSNVAATATGGDRFLGPALAESATEIVLSEGKPPMLRIGGELRQMGPDPVQAPELWDFLIEHMGADVLDRLAEARSLSQGLQVDGRPRGRIVAFRQIDGASVVVRLHPEAVRSAAEARIPDAVVQAMQRPDGMILLTGPVGSGVTSTMATLLAAVESAAPKRAIVLDECVEYPPATGNLDVVYRRVGRDIADYEQGIESALSEGPDLLMIADVSTPRAFDMALRAAEMGCLVVAALNARDTRSALVRVLNFYPSYDVQRIRNSLAGALRCVLRQQLVPISGGGGEVLATELLRIDLEAQTILREGELSRLGSLISLQSGDAGHSLDQSLEQLHVAGLIRLEDGFRFADDKTRYLKRGRTRERARS